MIKRYKRLFERGTWRAIKYTCKLLKLKYGMKFIIVGESAKLMRNKEGEFDCIDLAIFDYGQLAGVGNDYNDEIHIIRLDKRGNLEQAEILGNVVNFIKPNGGETKVFYPINGTGGRLKVKKVVTPKRYDNFEMIENLPVIIE